MNKLKKIRLTYSLIQNIHVINSFFHTRGNLEFKVTSIEFGTDLQPKKMHGWVRSRRKDLRHIIWSATGLTKEVYDKNGRIIRPYINGIVKPNTERYDKYDLIKLITIN